MVASTSAPETRTSPGECESKDWRRRLGGLVAGLKQAVQTNIGAAPWIQLDLGQSLTVVEVSNVLLFINYDSVCDDQVYFESGVLAATEAQDCEVRVGEIPLPPAQTADTNLTSNQGPGF